MNVIRSTTISSASKNLIKYFDSPTFWNTNKHSSLKTTGLFGYPSFSTPKQIYQIAQQSIHVANKIVTQVVNASEQEEILKTVKRLDALSDLLCSVVDAAQLIRSVHVNHKFVIAAEKVQDLVGNYINQLNTHSGIYSALQKVMSFKHLLSKQEQMVAQLLLHDLEKSGIQMSQFQKNTFIQLNDQIRELGYQFIENAGHLVESHLVIKNNRECTEGIPVSVLKGALEFYDAEKKSYIIPLHSPLSQVIYNTCRNEDIRRDFYMSFNSASKQQIKVLEDLLKSRVDLSKLLGKSCYGELFLQDKMARNPENTLEFLTKFSNSHLPLAQECLNRLQIIKRHHTQTSDAILQPWDIPFYSQFADLNASQSSTLSSYFSLGRVVEGLSSILTDLFGISLEPESILFGETWHDQVRKLNVIHKDAGKIGTIYCDFFQRGPEQRPKVDEAAHYTIRCSRVLFQDIEKEQKKPFLVNLCREKMLKDPFSDEIKLYQLPIVVLNLGLTPPTNDKPCLLNLEQVETLFHEMGHAVHSMLSRTEFQHISGTRVPLDFVEVPSTFMEQFLKYPKVVSQFASHYLTDEPLDINYYKQHQESRENSISSILETQSQLKLAILDQMYHSREFEVQNYDSSKIHSMVQSQFYPVPFIPNTASQVHFSHLFMYGSIYYSYFWARKISDQLHLQFTQNGDRKQWLENGNLLNKELFGLGNSRDPWIGLENLKLVQPGSFVL